MLTLSRYIRLSIPKQLLLIESVLILIVMRICLRLLQYTTLNRLLMRFDGKIDSNQPANTNRQDDIIWAIRKTGEKLYGENTCLPLALAGQLQLNLHGFPARTQLGVSKTDEGMIKAHAWVECNGDVVIGGPELDIKQYIVLTRIDRNTK